MPRINIEDRLYRDERFFKLVAAVNGDIDTALGAMARAFDLAQKYFLKGTQKIPMDDWNKLRRGQLILDVGLARIENGEVYVCGSDKEFAWLLQRSNAGKNSALAKKAKFAQGQRPLTPVESRQLPPTSSSSSFSEEKEKNKQKESFQLESQFNAAALQSSGEDPPPLKLLKPEQPSKLDEVVVAVINELNRLTGQKNLPTTKLTRQYIQGLIKSGYLERDMLWVIKHKCQEWGSDSKMQSYLRPSTLFRMNKFPDYLAQAIPWNKSFDAVFGPPPGEEICVSN